MGNVECKQGSLEHAELILQFRLYSPGGQIGQVVKELANGELSPDDVYSALYYADGRPVGCALLLRHAPLPGTCTKAVAMVWVKPQHRRCGVASVLMHRLRRFAEFTLRDVFAVKGSKQSPQFWRHMEFFYIVPGTPIEIPNSTEDFHQLDQEQQNLYVLRTLMAHYAMCYHQQNLQHYLPRTTNATAPPHRTPV